MTFKLFDAPEREASLSVGFSGNVIDRRAEQRSDDSALAALADPAARVMVLGAGRACLRSGADGFDLWCARADAEAIGARLDQVVLLGWDERGPALAASTALDSEAMPEGVKGIDFRSIHMQGLLASQDLGALAQGAALVAWHASHRFCSRCGAESQARAGGYKRVCPSCNAEHFPRTDPVAIMLAVTPERCLMGRGRHFAPGMYSCLAGFIEPGETIEAAVRRETFEEAGIRVGRVAYHASQPWPFPYSLMIGCYGEALNEDIVCDVAELEDVRWFSRDEVRAIIEKRSPEGITMPPPMAIAHHLIRSWADAE